MDGIRRSKRKTEPKGNQNIVEKDCSKKSASDSVIQSSVSVKKPSQNVIYRNAPVLVIRVLVIPDFTLYRPAKQLVQFAVKKLSEKLER